GLLMFTAPDPDIAFIEEVTHFPLLYHPSPQRVLLIGGGVGGVLNEILKHPVTKVVYVELDPIIIQVAREHSLTRALDDPRLRIELTDGRLFVSHTQEKYDVIIVNLSPPSTLQLNRAYTQEFFRKVHNILSPGGILSFGLPWSETYVSQEMISHNRCIYETVKKVFPGVSIIPGERSIFLASADPAALTNALETIYYRFQDRDLATRLLTVPYIQYKLSPERIERLLAPLRAGEPVETNQDLRPIGTYHNLALWNVMFYPGSRGFFNWISRMQLWWFLIPVGLLLTVPISINWRRVSSRPMLLPVVLAIMTTGFAGMTFSLISFLAFQTLHGYLYQKIGILVAAFMLGLAFGGLSMNHIMNKLRRDILALGKIELAISGYAFLLPLILILLFAHLDKLPPFIPAEVPLSLLNWGAGFLVGLEFPLANKIYLGSKSGVGRVAGTLYASDLCGAIVGAVLTSVFLIPILGISKTCLVIAMFKIASLVVLITATACPRKQTKGA
ncbi:spermine/spermidine synthase domain-containing protein, partial [Candidatus Hakubella thermalkaliphila]